MELCHQWQQAIVNEGTIGAQNLRKTRYWLLSREERFCGSHLPPFPFCEYGPANLK